MSFQAHDRILLNREYQQANARSSNQRDAYTRGKIIERAQRCDEAQEKLKRMKEHFEALKMRRHKESAAQRKLQASQALRTPTPPAPSEADFSDSSDESDDEEYSVSSWNPPSMYDAETGLPLRPTERSGAYDATPWPQKDPNRFPDPYIQLQKDYAITKRKQEDLDQVVKSGQSIFTLSDQSQAYTDAINTEAMTINNLVIDTAPKLRNTLYADAGMYSPFVAESDRATQSMRGLGGGVNFMESYNIKVEKMIHASEHTLAAVEKKFEKERHLMNEDQVNDLKREILNLMKEKHTKLLQTMINDELEREKKREVKMVMNPDKHAKKRIGGQHNKERKFHAHRFKCVRTDCEMMLAKRLIELNLVR
jgi:hypothetical protein